MLLLFVALILLYRFVLFPIFLRECIFCFTTFSFTFLYFFSFLSLLFIFYFSGSFVLVQVIQVMGFYRFFIIKIKGNGEFVQGGK